MKREKKAPTDEAAKDLPLSIEEEDAYAHIVLLAQEAKGADDDSATDESKADETGKRGRKTRVREKNIASACARRFLIHWFDGSRAKKAMEAAHCNWGDITVARFADADYKVAFEFVEAERPRLLQAAALDMSERVLDGEDVPAHAARLASFILERTKRKEFGRDTAPTGTGPTAGPAVTYNINLIAAPPPPKCDQSVTASPPPYEIAQ